MSEVAYRGLPSVSLRGRNLRLSVLAKRWPRQQKLGSEAAQKLAQQPTCNEFCPGAKPQPTCGISSTVKSCLALSSFTPQMRYPPGSAMLAMSRASSWLTSSPRGSRGDLRVDAPLKVDLRPLMRIHAALDTNRHPGVRERDGAHQYRHNGWSITAAAHPIRRSGRRYRVLRTVPSAGPRITSRQSPAVIVDQGRPGS